MPEEQDQQNGRQASRRSAVAAAEARNSPLCTSWLRSKNQPLPCLGAPSSTLSSWLPSTH